MKKFLSILTLTSFLFLILTNSVIAYTNSYSTNSNSGVGIFMIIFNLVICFIAIFILLASLAIPLIAGLWTYNDAKKRNNKDAVLWLVLNLVLGYFFSFFANIILLIIYFFTREKNNQQ